MGISKSFTIAVAAAILLSACATGTHIVTGPRRAEISADQVTLYQSPPSSYEVIGIVNATSPGHNQVHMDAAVKALKKQAAKIGANGIILGEVGGGSVSGTAAISSRGTVFAGALGQPIQLSGQAIYVPATAK